MRVDKSTIAFQAHRMIARGNVIPPRSMELLDSDSFVDVYNTRLLFNVFLEHRFIFKKLLAKKLCRTIKETIFSGRSPVSICRQRNCYRRVMYLKTTQVRYFCQGRTICSECFQNVSRAWLGNNTKTTLTLFVKLSRYHF